MLQGFANPPKNTGIMIMSYHLSIFSHNNLEQIFFHPAFGYEAAPIRTSNLHGAWVPRLIHGHGVGSALLWGIFPPVLS